MRPAMTGSFPYKPSLSGLAMPPTTLAELLRGVTFLLFDDAYFVQPADILMVLMSSSYHLHQSGQFRSPTQDLLGHVWRLVLARSL